MTPTGRAVITCAACRGRWTMDFPFHLGDHACSRMSGSLVSPVKFDPELGTCRKGEPRMWTGIDDPDREKCGAHCQSSLATECGCLHCEGRAHGQNHLARNTTPGTGPIADDGTSDLYDRLEAPSKRPDGKVRKGER